MPNSGINMPTLGISPCIKHCKLDRNNICIGCKRTLDEIREFGLRLAESKGVEPSALRTPATVFKAVCLPIDATFQTWCRL
jgi:hypothetical protein